MLIEINDEMIERRIEKENKGKGGGKKGKDKQN